MRTVLSSLGFALLLGTFAACGGSDSDGEPAASMIPARPDETAAKASRGACTFARGAMPRDTLGATVPVGTDIPIDTVVVLMLENHSFDNYFARLGKYAGRTDIEGAPEDASNPDKAGAKHAFEHAPRLCTLDVNHEWKGTHESWADGRMDGFYMANDGWEAAKLPAGADPTLASGSRSMIYYDERDIPFYYKLASTFAIADHFHSSLLGPTWPNRMYLLSATSFGKTTNTFPELSAFKYPDNPASILDALEKAKVSWNLYTDGLPGAGVVHAADILKRWDRKVNYDTATFLSEAAAGKLPNVSFLDPHIGAEGPDQNDEHPPADIQVGEKFVSDIVHALMASPQWPRMALFITWDEHGGYYDHSPRPRRARPTGWPPRSRRATRRAASIGTASACRSSSSRRTRSRATRATRRTTTRASRGSSRPASTCPP